MIYDIPRMTQEEYANFKKQFYFKPGAPEIEITLQKYQEELLLNNNLEILPVFKRELATYARSHVLKLVKGGSDYIEPSDVEALADLAAENFVKRYFRNDEPAVGASFSGILIYKVREVLSEYFKNSGLETGISLDTTIGDEENSNLSNEAKLSLKEYQKKLSEELVDMETTLEFIFERIEKECELLKKVKEVENAEGMFLKYLLYTTLLQKTGRGKKLTLVSNQALSLLDLEDSVLPIATPILESALLDVQTN